MIMVIPKNQCRRMWDKTKRSGLLWSVLNDRRAINSDAIAIPEMFGEPTNPNTNYTVQVTPIWLIGDKKQDNAVKKS
jgi:hypothetical protein